MADVTFCTYVVTTDAAGESSLPVCSVPPPSKPIARTAPDPKRVPSFFRGFLVGWYGNTTLQQISEARRAALRQRRTLYRIDVVIDGGAYAPSRQYKTDLSSLGVIHVDLLPKETEAVFCEHLGIRTPKKATGYEVSDFLWKHPGRLKELWEIPQLKSLNAVILSGGIAEARVYYGAIHPDRIKEIRPPLNYPHAVNFTIKL